MAKRPSISEQLRAIINASEMSRYEICKQTEIDQAALSRFMAGSGISTSTVDALAELFDLEIVKRAGRKKKSIK